MKGEAAKDKDQEDYLRGKPHPARKAAKAVAEIKAENGMWILRDTGSTNGTYVNNRRVDRHELVDNDFIKFGSAMLKFKSL